ncbi:MAG: S8 family serine peptidase, partial [Actinomycetota bacterium]|nr:S8 family serine peptidase [Actinomycetota bacterium]
QQNGTSFSSPEVAAAAAMLKSLDPELQAADIKRILTETARTSIKTGDTEVAAPAGVGGKVLAIDQAVLKVINDQRKAKGMPELTKELLEQRGVIDAVAITGSPGEYQVKGIVKAAGDKGTDVTIEVWAQNSAVGGKTTQSVAGGAGGECAWSVTLPEDKGTIRVTRNDNGAASLITIEKIDINGAWSGSFTITDITITDQGAAEDQGCSVTILQALKGQAFPMSMHITADESGHGFASTIIDMSSLNEDGGNNDPQTWGVSYDGRTITFSPEDAQGVSGLNSVVSRSGETFVQNGSMSGAGAGWSMKAVFTLSKPAP